MTTPHIVVYAKTACPWAAAVKAFLAVQGFEFEDRDMERSVEHRREAVEVSGRAVSPTVVIENTIIIDASVEEVAEELHNVLHQSPA